jgi:3-dehydroquinate synthase
VAPLYAEAAAAALGKQARVTLATFPAGETSKTRAVWSDLTDRLLAGGLGRDGAIVALGGGVVGDLAGFVAATYLRGIPYVQVPTSLLAMLDSSIGGKTGVDTPAGKNLVGAFHQPRAVIADIATLATLPRNHRLAAMAEAIKHGAVADRDYFERVRALAPAVLLGTGDPDALREIVEQSIALKAAIVAQDEREHGRRAVLNFGHTIGHAVEAATGYALLHGEAVACGMAREAQLGRALGITTADAAEAIVETLTAYRLPTSLPPKIDPARLLELMRADKKARDATVRFALVETLGKMHRDPGGAWTTTASEQAIHEALAAPQS